MNKSSSADLPLEEQRRMWNLWNARAREQQQSYVALRQAEVVDRWLHGARDLEILDAGCGAGWLCERLLAHGRVTGVDLADEVVARAALRVPSAKFVAGDLMTLDLPVQAYDVVVSLEVLSHVADQPALIERFAKLMKVGGELMLATQNRPILERWSEVGPPEPGQLRHWVDARTLRRLLRPHFEIDQLISLVPVGDQGFLRVTQSVKLNKLLSAVFKESRITALKERLMLGHTLMVRARRLPLTLARPRKTATPLVLTPQR